MPAPTWIIYGANGYTGRLIAREARRRRLTPILAGRSPKRIAPVAAELGLEYRIFALDSPADVALGLHGAQLVLNCAGPFSATAAPMIDACLAGRVHYLDITGEIDVFERAHERHDQARRAGIVLLPGAGFDVVPTDCLAATLRVLLPDADHLSLGFDSRSEVSPGTAKTAIEGLARGGCIRAAGKLQPLPLAARTRRIDFGAGEKLATAIPWGDVATAYYSTGIPNIDAWLPVSPSRLAQLRRLDWFRGVLGTRWAQALLKRGAERRLPGPDEEARAKSRIHVWGEVQNAAGRRVTARVITPDGYSFTAESALAIAASVLAQRPGGGFYTPSQLLGPGFLQTLPGVSPIAIS